MPVQLDLFEDRTLRLGRCRSALAEAFDFERAGEEARAALARYPGDREAEWFQTAVEGISAALGAALADGRDIVTALLDLEPTLPGWLLRGWHRRLAAEAERLRGEGCRVGAEAAGFHLLRAGDLAAAERSLRATLADTPGDARSRARLADVLHLRGEAGPAAVEYLRALVEAPQTVDWDGMANPEVAALPSIAATEHDLGADAPGWAAAVGTIEGALPWPHGRLGGLREPEPVEPARPGLRFHRLLCEERAARNLADRAHIRGYLKVLCPSLLRRYLERWR